MAKEIIINAKINTGNSAQDIKNVEEELSKLNDELVKSGSSTENLENDLKNLNTQVSNGGLSMRELSKKIKEYQTIAIKSGAESPIGKEAIKNAAKLYDELDAIKLQTKALGDGEQNFKAALTLGEGVVQGYQGFLGVTTLLGNENERLVETLTKLQAAQGVVNSISAIRGALDNDNILVLKAKLLYTKAATAAETLYGAAVGTSTGALKVFRLALIGTGIGAIVVALGLLIANWSTFTDWVKKSIDKLREYKNYIAFLMPPLYLLIQTYDMVIAVLQKLGITQSEQVEKAIEDTNKRIEAIQKERTAIGDRYDFEIAKLKAAGKSTVEIEQEKRKAIAETLKAEALAIQQQVRNTKEFTDEQKERLKELQKDAVTISRETVIAQITAEKEADDKRKALAEERKKAADKDKERVKQIQLEDEAARMEQNAIDLENKMLQTEALKVYDDAYFMSQIELADEVNVNNDRLIDIEREREAKKLKETQEREQLVFDTKLGLASQATSAILANMEQGSNAYKAVAAAQVVFDTYRGIQGTFASATANPTSILFPAQPYIQAGIAATFGFANVRKILSSSPAKASGGVSAPSTGGGGGGAFSSPSMATPKNQINMFGQGFQGGEILADKKKTYKVEVNANEISAAQSSNTNQSNFASL